MIRCVEGHIVVEQTVDQVPAPQIREQIASERGQSFRTGAHSHAP